MRVNSAAAVLLPAVVSWPSATAVDYLEPHVQRHASVLPPSVCKQLIELGEKAGFLIREESIDEDEQDDPTNKYIPSQTIDVYDNGSDPLEYTGEAEVGDEAIWSVLQPWIPEITQIVKDNRNKEGFAQFYPDDPDREPKLHWIFFRKYSPEDERNSLKHHHDTNMNTVNIELSNDYTGGGLFYIKPRASTGKISKQINDAGYEWIDTIKRENTSEIVFPDLRAGDAIFYNYTVEHGVAPCESGTRYSMAFFYDMDNPAVEDDFDEVDDEESSEDEEEFDIKLHNGLTEDLDVFVVHEENDKERLFAQLRPNETIDLGVMDEELLQFVVTNTEHVVSEIEVSSGQSSYTISEVHFEPGAQLHVEPHVQRHPDVLPPTVCKQLIELGEKAGFLIREESIDEEEQHDSKEKYVPSQTIDVYDNGTSKATAGMNYVGDEAIWSVLQPWIPKITQIVKDNRNKEGFSQFYPDDPDKEPELHWIFFRKYSPDDERNSLKHHHDTNMNTVNIELSNDYTGGGLFYIKPRISTGEISKTTQDSGYEWIDTLKRENTSEIIFPDLRAGDAIFYNYTVEHGVAPCESGTRYSMAFFYDMDNPAVKDDFDEYDDPDYAGKQDEFKIELQNGLSTDLDVFLVHEGDEKERVFAYIHPNETVDFLAIDRDVLQFVTANSGEVVSQIEVHKGLSSHTISDPNVRRSEL